MANTFKNYASASITTQTTVYTAPSATQSTIIGMTVANTDNATANISVEVTVGYVVKGAPVPMGGALVPIGGDQKVVLEAADAIKVTSDQTVDVLLSVLEIS